MALESRGSAGPCYFLDASKERERGRGGPRVYKVMHVCAAGNAIAIT